MLTRLFTRRSTIVAVALVALASTAFAGATLYAPEPPLQPSEAELRGQDADNLVNTLRKSANYKTMAQLLELAGLGPTFTGSAQFTVFAPTDAAFAELPKATMDGLKADTAALKKVLLYHVVNSAVPSNQVLKLKTARTLQGARIEFSMKDGKLYVNDATVIQPDIKASNGVIHGISKVLMK